MPREPPAPKKFQSLLWGEYGYFLELHIKLKQTKYHCHLQKKLAITTPFFQKTEYGCFLKKQNVCSWKNFATQYSKKHWVNLFAGKKKQKIYVLHRIRLQCTRLHTDPKNLHHHCKLPIEINFFFCHQMFAVSSLN